MMRPSRPQFVSDAILVDEIGIEIGIYGSYQLMSSYQPIFARRGEFLLPLAAEGLIAPHLGGQPVASGAFFRQVPREDVLFVESMCRALHLRNYRNIGVERLQLFFNYDPCANSDLEKALNEIAFMARRLAEIGLDPGLLVCEVTETAAHDAGTLSRLVAGMRSHGIRIAVDDFGVGHSTLERIALLRPDIVKLDGGWFRKLAADKSAVGLLSLAVRGLQATGAEVLIEGIETPLHLRAAMQVGADLMQGYLLAAPALAGAIFDQTPRPFAGLLAAERKVIPLFG